MNIRYLLVIFTMVAAALACDVMASGGHMLALTGVLVFVGLQIMEPS